MITARVLACLRTSYILRKFTSNWWVSPPQQLSNPTSAPLSAVLSTLTELRPPFVTVHAPTS